MNCDALQQWTALEALGALDGPDVSALRERLDMDAAARAELSRFLEVVTALAGMLPQVTPPLGLRAKVMERIQRTAQVARAAGSSTPGAMNAAALPPVPEGIHFIRHDAPWVDGPLPGTRYKVLSASAAQEYAMLMIELGPGAIYPEHDHVGSEEMYVLTGDLQSEGRSLGPGDFLHAEGGSHHHELRSIEGCTALMVVPRVALAGMAGVP
ncbi:MAG: cupin domain-containing protein [Verrucomicrobiales bacterium]|nr:cupin domain-containing protein [Verrucomicrobiales bacterium]